MHHILTIALGVALGLMLLGALPVLVRIVGGAVLILLALITAVIVAWLACNYVFEPLFIIFVGYLALVIATNKFIHPRLRAAMTDQEWRDTSRFVVKRRCIKAAYLILWLLLPFSYIGAK